MYAMILDQQDGPAEEGSPSNGAAKESRLLCCVSGLAEQPRSIGKRVIDRQLWLGQWGALLV